jgi:hypothetical protein
MQEEQARPAPDLPIPNRRAVRRGGRTNRVWYDCIAQCSIAFIAFDTMLILILAGFLPITQELV